MTSPSGAPPFRVIYSELCREQTRLLLMRARARGRFTEVAQAIRDVNTRLEWIPLDFGDPLRELVHMGLQERISPVPPLVVTYFVDEARRIVYVPTPLQTPPQERAVMEGEGGGHLFRRKRFRTPSSPPSQVA